MSGNSNRLFSPLWRPKMIVFDKDGTLGDCTNALRNWSSEMTLKIEGDCSLNGISVQDTRMIVERFHASVGWNTQKNELIPSALLAAGTWEEVLTATAVSLEVSGVSNARTKVNEWHGSLGEIHANDEMLIPNLPEFISYFREIGILVAICTSDDRKATEACIRNWKLNGLIDFTLCGDEVIESKPSAYPLLALCKSAGVLPEECIVVGDTIADVGMAIQGNAGAIFGVLSGSGTADQLYEMGADIVFPNIGFLTNISNLFLRSDEHTADIIEHVQRIRTVTPA